MAKVNVNLSDTIQQWVNDTNALSNDVGDITQLTTTIDSDVVGAINSLKTAVDNLDSDVTNIDITADARLAISVTDAGGDGSLAYNNSTGVLTYTGPSAAEVRAHLSAGTGISYNSSTGVISHSDTSSVANVSSNNSGNTYIQDISLTFDTFGHVTGASVATNTLSLSSFGITSTSTELNYTDGVTSSIQTQLDGKAANTNASVATSISLTGAASAWQFALSGNDLIIKYGSTTLAKLDTSGNLTVTGNVTAYGSL